MTIIAAAGAAAAAGCTASSASSASPANAAPASEAVRAVLPLGFPWRTRDPFLFCVHHDDAYPLGNDRLGPAASLAGRQLGSDFDPRNGWRMYHGEVVPGFPQHPHRGFETVTVVRRGFIDHSDSLGATARYGGGDVQWLTAGKGIQHAEMFPLVHRDRANPLELFQIWLNLPKSKKFAEPRFAMFWNDKIPKREVRDEAGRVTTLAITAGAYEDLAAIAPPPDSWAAVRENEVAIWTIALSPGARFTLPPAAHAETNRSLYFFSGSELAVAGMSVPAAHEIELAADRAVCLEAGAGPVELLLLQGRPIGEPTVQYGPFVMNTRAEIADAFADYQRTQFGGWPWPRLDPVHAPEETRFAKHADGRLERPA